jgi:hypothetical protein
MVELRFEVSEDVRRRFKAFAASIGADYAGALERLLDNEKQKMDKDA